MDLLDKEEYVEQSYLFRTYLERLEDRLPAQEILSSIKEEVLATTRLPTVIDFLLGELRLKGKVSEGMAHLAHYFTPFQAFVMERAEEDDAKFDLRTALQILDREASYRAVAPTKPGLFIFQLETVSRNRLGYDAGLQAIARDPLYDADWSEWIGRVKRQLGIADLAELVYYRSQWYVDQLRRTQPEFTPSLPILFGHQEGRIAFANRAKDPLYLFSALQRHLSYPTVPRTRKTSDDRLPPQLEARLLRLEKRLQLMESEAKGKLDLSEFIVRPPANGDADFPAVDR